MGDGERVDLCNTAEFIAVRAGAIKECKHHDGIYLDSYDREAQKKAYAMGTNMIKDGKIDFERKDLMSAIKSAIDDAGAECYACKKLESE